MCPKPFLVASVHAAAADSLQLPALHVVSGIVNLPSTVDMAEVSWVVSEYPAPALVDTTRSWQPMLKLFTGKVPKVTDVGDVPTAVTDAPSSAVQLTAATLETVNVKLSGIDTCTITPELMETSTLPDPPNVPPTAIVYTPPVEGFVIECPPCWPTVAFDPILIVTCVDVGTYTPVPEGGPSVMLDPVAEKPQAVAVAAHPG